MKNRKTINSFIKILCLVLLIAFSVVTVSAHPGRTDSSGGHKDNKNKSGLGSYHYHCGGYSAHLHTKGYCPYRDVFPSSVKIECSKTVLGVGEKVSITAAVYPSNSCDTNIKWSCSDASIVSFSDGVVTAKEYGNATIVAETFNGKKGTIKITVKEITADKVTIHGMPDFSDFYIGDMFTLAATIIPENVDNPSIVWSSSNNEIATVSEGGDVKLISEGKVEIRATASNGVFGKAVINVKEKFVETLDIAESEMDVFLGEKHTLIASITPEDATRPEITWSVEEPAIVSISEDGVIEAIDCGETVVLATSTNGISDSIVIRVNEIKAEAIEIDGIDAVLIGNSLKLSTIFTPSNTSDQNVEWSLDNTTIASISADGLLVANNVGIVSVTAKQKDVSATCLVEILPIKVDDISIITSTEDAISTGDTVSFSAEVFPKNATYSNITWSVSDPKIASIDTNGVLTALKGGTVTVIATSTDGFSAECEVSVYSPLAWAIGTACIASIGVTIIFAIRKKRHRTK